MVETSIASGDTIPESEGTMSVGDTVPESEGTMSVGDTVPENDRASSQQSDEPMFPAVPMIADEYSILHKDLKDRFDRLEFYNETVASNIPDQDTRDFCLKNAEDLASDYVAQGLESDYDYSANAQRQVTIRPILEELAH